MSILYKKKPHFCCSEVSFGNWRISMSEFVNKEYIEIDFHDVCDKRRGIKKLYIYKVSF